MTHNELWVLFKWAIKFEVGEEKSLLYTADYQ